MKKTLVTIIGRAAASLVSCVLLCALFTPAFAAGELSINSTSAVIQNFGSLGNSTTATLPTGWLMSAAGGGNSSTWTTANQTAINQQASSGAPSTGGRYNWGSNATDRALGFMTSGSYASPNSILYGITNNTGGLVTSIDLAFDYERYRTNTAAASVAFSYSPDGTTWTAFASGDSGAFSTGNSSYTFGNGTVVSSSFTLSDLNLANAANFYFRWNFNTIGSNSQGIGLDNVSLTLNSGGVPTSFTTWTGTGSPGTWSDGTAGQFGGNYANDLANTVTFAGTGTAVTTSGTPQAGSLFFNSTGYTLAGAVQLGVGNITTAAAATTTTISANISGNGSSGLTKLGAGTLILSGSNSYTGSTAISAGVLEARHANALGTTAAGTIVSDGATLALSNSIAIGAETLGLSGNGSSSSGALRNLSGSNTYAGAILLNANSRIHSDAGTLTLTGGITGTGRALTIAGAGATTLSSSGLNTSTGGTLLKTDAGTLTISASSSYTGGTSVTGGTLTASHNSALGTGAVTITSGTVQASSGITLGNDFTIGAPGGGGSVITLQSWDFTGQNTALAASGANVTSSGLNTGAAFNLLTRGATANASAAGNSFRTTGFQNDGISTANTDYFQWQIASTGANALSLSTLDARFAGTSSFRASPGVSAQFAYSLDNSTYTLIGSPFSLTADAAMPQIDLSGITALQGLGSNATITLRYYASGNTTTGGWGFNSPSAGQNGLELRGSVSVSGGPGTGSATLGLNTAGAATYSGNLTIHGAATLTAATGATATFSGDFSGAGNLTKTGLGTVLLTGNASHTGGTTVSEGTLRANGYVSGTVLVQTGATLGGSGTIAGLVTLNSGATLTPGNSVGTLTFANGLTLNSTSTITMEINGDSDFDKVIVSGGTLTLGGTLNLVFGYTPTSAVSYQLFDATGASTIGSFASVQFSNAANGTFDSTTGSLTLGAVPEPSTWALIGLGSAFLLWRTRRKPAC